MIQFKIYFMCISGILFKFQSQFHTEGDLNEALLLKLLTDLPGKPLKLGLF